MNSVDSTGAPPNGWKPTHWQVCGERFVLVTVVNKLDTFKEVTSKIVLDIGVSALDNGSKYFLPGLAIFSTTLALISSYF